MVKMQELTIKMFKELKKMNADHAESVVRNTDTGEPIAGVFVTTHPGLTKAIEQLVNRYTE